MDSGPLLPAMALLLLLAGCAEPAAPPAPPPETPPDVETTETVDWSATVTGLCVVSAGGNLCANGPSVNGGSNSDAEPTYVHDAANRSLAGGELILEWDANTIATETLRIVATAYTGCPDECEVNRTLGSAIGASPLSLPVPPLESDGLQVFVRVEKVEFAPGMQATHGQPIHLGGSLRFLEGGHDAVASPDASP